MSDGSVRVLMLAVGLEVGGAEQLILTTAPRLRREGFDVMVAGLKGRGRLAEELEAAGVRTTALEARHRFDLRALRRLRRLLVAERIQVLHSHMFLANVTARIVGRLAGVPVVVSAHHDTDLWMGWRHRLLERTTARLADRIVTCSDAVRRFAVERIGLPAAKVTTLRNSIVVPPLGIAPEERTAIRGALGAESRHFLVGTLGRLDEPKKGLETFLGAASRVARDIPQARFALVGDGPARAHLERVVREVGLDGRVVFAGERRDVAEVMQSFDLFVQPSLWEGFGLSLLEAMAARRPIVATRVGGIPEIVRDGLDGVLVPPGDEEALAQAITALWRDAGRSDLLARSGRERVEREFGIDRLVAETAALYRGLLRGTAEIAAPRAALPPRRAA